MPVKAKRPTVASVARVEKNGRPALARPARDFLVAARDRFGELERVASAAANDLDQALIYAVDDLYKRDPEEARRLEAFGESLVEHQRTVAERSGHLRRRLERRGQLPPAPSLFGRRADDIEAEDVTDADVDRTPESGPSEGVVVLARQMAAEGVDEERIAGILTVLGVDDADQAVHESLHRAPGSA